MKKSLLAPVSLAGKKSLSAHTKLAVWSLVGGFLGVLIALVMFAPAVWLSYLIEQNTNQHVRLLNANGTVWNGTAELVLTGGPNSREIAQLPGHIHWHLAPSFTQANASLWLDCCMANAVNLDFNWGWKNAKFKLQDGQIKLPGAILSALGAPWNTLGLQAEIELQQQGLELQWVNNQFLVQGQLNIQINQASSKLSTIKPLGSYLVVIKGGSVPQLQLSTTEGSLILTGTGQWSGNRLRFSGEASATPEREQALGNLLNIIGRRSGSRSIITLG